jgi:curved DNA-binding protein CbpA
MRSYYQILGLSNFASLDDIKRAYRALALQHHPDRGGDAEIMKTINVAYEFLVKNKERYDVQLRPRVVTPAGNRVCTIIVGGWNHYGTTATSTSFRF